MSWTLICQTSTAFFALLIGHLFLWRHLHRAPAGGLRRISGQLVGTGESGARLATAATGVLEPGGRLVLRVENDSINARERAQQVTNDAPLLSIDVGGATLRVLPGPADRRREPDLRDGDRVIAYGFDGERGFQALRLIRSGWREPGRWLEPAAAVSALVAVVALTRTHLDQLRVAEIIAPATPLLAQRPTPAALRELTRPIERYYPFAGDAQPPPGEPGLTQGFLEYVESDPRTADGERLRLYLQPIGPLSPGQRRALRLSAEFLARFFCLPVAIAESLPLSEIPDDGRRVHNEWGIQQLQSTRLIHKLLRARLPRDGAGMLGITAIDLWPGEGWHAVRGQASLVERVGIVSIFRSGLADKDESSFRIFLRRTIKLMVHEAGHLFSMRHCPLDGCVMSGRNETEVSDQRHPLLCSQCLAKLVWATRCDPLEWHRTLARFCRQQGLNEEAAIFQTLGAALRGW